MKPSTVYGSVPVPEDTVENFESVYDHAFSAKIKQIWSLGALLAAGSLVVCGFVSTTSSNVTLLEENMNVKNMVYCVESSYENDSFLKRIKGLQFEKVETKKVKKKSKQSVIRVNENVKKQKVLGFGGAFTEAAAIQFAKLSKKKQNEFLKLYFDTEDGAGYTFGRVPMNSCDFSPESFSFDDVVNDTSLEHFDMNVTHDTVLQIPFLKRAIEKQPDLKLFFAPWSPPAWMKYPNQFNKTQMVGSASPHGLQPQFQSTWANYFLKYIQAYENHGIKFWGLTPQNEPEFAAPWEACAYDASYQADFVGNHLGPLLKSNYPDIKLMYFDHNRGSVPHWAETFANSSASKYVDGIAFHWYDDQRILDGVQYHDFLNETHFFNPNQFLLATESCNCPTVANGTLAWFRAERYAHDIMADLNNYASGWVDWNLILDSTGGPNHLGNNCDAPFIIDDTDADYYIQPMYYYIRHISQYVPPQSIRMLSTIDVKFDAKKPGDPQLYTLYPVGVYNCDNSARQKYILTDDHKIQIENTPLCVDIIEDSWLGAQVQLVECVYTSRTWQVNNSTHQIIGYTNTCLTSFHNSIENGARATVENCDESNQLQSWSYDTETKEIKQGFTDRCLTAGYAFVQGVTFETPERKKVMVVMNENSEDITFNIELEGKDVQVETKVPKHGIRTFVWE